MDDDYSDDDVIEGAEPSIEDKQTEESPASGDNVHVEIVEHNPTIAGVSIIDGKFPKNYSLLITYGKYTRQTLIQAVQQKVKSLVDSGLASNDLNQFIGWMCRTLNLDPGLFNDYAILKRELELAQTNIDDVFDKNNVVEVTEFKFDEEELM